MCSYGKKKRETAANSPASFRAKLPGVSNGALSWSAARSNEWAKGVTMLCTKRVPADSISLFFNGEYKVRLTCNKTPGGGKSAHFHRLAADPLIALPLRGGYDSITRTIQA